MVDLRTIALRDPIPFSLYEGDLMMGLFGEVPYK